MPHRSPTRFLNRLLLTTGVALCLPMAAAQAAPVLFGDANVTVNGAPFAGGDIPVGAEVVVTGPLLQLQLADGSTITAPQGASFVITEEAGGGISIALISGSVRVDSQGAAVSVSRGGVAIATTGGAYSAFASADGGLDGRVNSGSATIVAGGQTRTFSAGQGYLASAGGVSGTFTPPAAQAAQFAANTQNATNAYSPADVRGAGGNPQIADDVVDDLEDEEEPGGPIGPGPTDPGPGPVDPGPGPVDPEPGPVDPEPGPGPVDPGHVDTTPGVSSGSVDVVFVPSGGTDAVAFASHEMGLDVRADAIAVVDANGALESYSAGLSGTQGENPARGTALVAELGGNAIITVGRWNGGTMGGSYFSMPALTWGGQQGFHYAVGSSTVTPITGGGVVNYTLLGATKPTFGDGRSAPGMLTGSLAVAFGPITRIGLDLSVDMPGDAVYAFATTGGVANPANSQLSLALADWLNDGSIFYGNDVDVTGTGTACPAGDCHAAIRSFFAGDVGQGIGMSYQIGDAFYPAPHSIYGAAIFTGAGGTPYDPADGHAGGVISGAVTASLGAAPYLLASNSNAANVTEVTLGASGQVTGFQNIYTGEGGAQVGTAGVADLWGNADITLGRWTDGSVTGAAMNWTHPSGGALFPQQGIHYFAGRQLTNRPAWGKAVYTLASATKPTYEDGSSEPGTFSGSLAVHFGNPQPRVGFDFTVTMPDHTYVMSSIGGAANPHLPLTTSSNTLPLYVVDVSTGAIGSGLGLTINSGGAYGYACPNNANCLATVTGMLAGEGGSSAAIAYSIWQSAAPAGRRIHGAAAFTTTGAATPILAPSAPFTPLPNGTYNAIARGVGGQVNPFINQTATFGPNGELVSFTTSGSAHVNVGSASVADLGSNDHAMWNRWTDGGAGGSSGTPTDLSGDRGGHWVVGTPGTFAPVGAVTYTLVGHTSPTFSDGSGAPGTLSGEVRVAWNGASSRLGAQLQIAMPGDTVYDLLTTGGLAGVGTGTNGIGWVGAGFFSGDATVTPVSPGAACVDPCSAALRAIPFGAGAPTIGLGYSIGGGGGLPSIHGVGVFEAP